MSLLLFQCRHLPFTFPTAVSRTSHTMGKDGSESRLLVIFLISVEKLSFFDYWIWCALWVVHMRLFYTEVVSLYSWSVESFLITKRHRIISNVLSINWVDCVFSPLILILFCIEWIDFCPLNQSCIPGINPIWSCYIILIYCWILFAGILVTTDTSRFIRYTVLLFSFLVAFLFGFRSEQCWPQRVI